MRKIILSPAAAKDIENILRFTLNSWGEKQFENYLSNFQKVFDTICFDPMCPMSKEREELFPGCRSIRADHHIVFFRLKTDKVQIIRILHEKMDFIRHFTTDF